MGLDFHSALDQRLLRSCKLYYFDDSRWTVEAVSRPRFPTGSLSGFMGNSEELYSALCVSSLNYMGALHRSATWLLSTPCKRQGQFISEDL